MSVLRLQWLGPPAIEYDGRPLKLEMRKSLALLAYLSLSPQKPTRETLAALFWSEYDQQHALANLRRNLSSLAKILPENLLEVDRERIGLRKEEWLKIDVDEFREQISSADKQFSDADKQDECISAYERAVKIFGGDFFEGFNLKDCSEFDDWQLFWRESLRAEYGKALERLAEAYRQIGEWEKAIDVARMWVALDRLHEPAQRLLMSMYFLSGQKSAALRQYEECQRVLAQELDQPPEAETLKLYEEIRKETPPEIQRAKPTSEVKASREVSGNLLTQTKFFLPKVPRTILHRPRLVAWLNQCVTMPLTLLSASAGFGKTTLLAEWAAQSMDTIAWVSLDREDNDVYRMLDYIVNAIRMALPETKVGLAAINLLQAPQPVQVSVIAGSLINDLIAITKRLILILDDYHNIESLVIHDLINFLLDHRPDNLHIIISTRSDPPLALARLRANIQLGDIRTDDLRFLNNETQSFFTQVIGFTLSSQDMAFFEDKVEGWIAGIQMAALVMQSREISQSSQGLRSFIHAFKSSQRHILDYLIEEVLNRQPEEIRTFLLRTSILDKLCFQLCDCLLEEEGTQEIKALEKPELFEKKSSQQILEFLERSNLFLIPLDDERKWYRYHHLFADLLHTRLQQYEPKLEAVLHQRAAQWYAQNSYSQEAIKHAISSGDYSLAADLIEEYSLKLIWMNQIVTTLDWFKLLPAEVIVSRPLLNIYQTFVLARKGEFERVEVILNNAEEFIRKRPHSAMIDEYKILIYGMHAFIANLQGETEKAIKYSQKISPAMGKQHLTSYFMAATQLAVAYHDKGDFPAAEKIYKQIVQWAQGKQDVYYTILTNKELAEVWTIQGRLSQVEQFYRKMYDWIHTMVEDPGLYDGLPKVYQAYILIEKNELETARLLLPVDIENSLSIWRTSSLYYGYMVQAYLCTALRDFACAREAANQSVQWVTSQNYYLRIGSRVQACLVNLWLAEGNLAEAQNWIQSNFPQMPTDFPFIRELDHICLARILVASQRWEEALDLLEHLSINAEAGKRFGRLLKINILRAIALDGLRRFEEALDVLYDCLYFASSEGYVRIFLDEGSPMKALLQHGAEEKRWQDPKIKDYSSKLLEAL